MIGNAFVILSSSFISLGNSVWSKLNEKESVPPLPGLSVVAHSTSKCPSPSPLIFNTSCPSRGSNLLGLVPRSSASPLVLPLGGERIYTQES